MSARLAQSVAAVAAMQPRTLGEALQQLAIVAAAWPRLSAHSRRKVRAAAARLAGLVEQRADRRTRRTRGIYTAESGLLDVDCAADGDRYVVVCEDHGSNVCVATLAAARTTGCLDFCDDCREACGS